jgi:hypothetical protein
VSRRARQLGAGVILIVLCSKVLSLRTVQGNCHELKQFYSGAASPTHYDGARRHSLPECVNASHDGRPIDALCYTDIHYITRSGPCAAVRRCAYCNDAVCLSSAETEGTQIGVRQHALAVSAGLHPAALRVLYLTGCSRVVGTRASDHDLLCYNIVHESCCLPSLAEGQSQRHCSTIHPRTGHWLAYTCSTAQIRPVYVSLPLPVLLLSNTSVYAVNPK